MNKQEQIKYLIKNNCDVNGFDLTKEFYNVEDWAKFLVEYPNDAWFIHTYLINELYQKHNVWRKEVLSKPKGAELLAELYNVKNPEIIKAWKKESKKLLNSSR